MPKSSFTALLLTLAALLVLASVFADGSYKKMQTLEESVQRQRTSNLLLRQRLDSLETEAYRLDSDPKYLEEVAREELGFVRENELLVIFDENDEIVDIRKGISAERAPE